MDMSQYLQIFIEESKENLQNLNQNLLKLENEPEDIQTLNEIFRVAHTLKGMSGTMGYVKMQKLTHNIENVLAEIRNGKIKVNPEMLDILFQCLDALENYVEEITNTSNEGNEEYQDLITSLTEITDGKLNKGTKESVSVNAEIAKVEAINLPEAQINIKNEALKMGFNVFEIGVILSPNCVLKSARTFIVFSELEKLGEIIHAVPSVKEIEDEKFEDNFKLILITHETDEAIKKILMGILEVDHVDISSLAGSIDEKLNKDTKLEGIVLPEAQINIKNEALKMGFNVFELGVMLSPNCVLKSARAFIIFSELERLGEIIHAVPSVQEIEDEKFEDSFRLILVTHETAEAIKEILMGIIEVDHVEISPFTQSEEKEKEQQPVAQVVKPGEAENKNKEQAGVNKQQLSGKTVRVNIDRLDTLMNLVSELIIVKTQLETLDMSALDDNNNSSDSIEYLERITTSLHDAVMKVRMVPVELVFNRFPRMIRDISRKLGKDIELVMEGEETELDRTVIDEIGDPLIHLLRNAADHGLETTKERIQLEKNPKGTIKLQAYQDGNSVVIEVVDDGKGINAKKIRDKAIERGMITKEYAATMSEQEMIELLFKPSFSTSEQITDLSGRGVGLDVVKSKITALGGHVEVETALGKGSKFIVRLPLTLAIIQALMVKIGEEKYAIPLNTIQNIEDVRKEEIKLVQKQEVIVLRNQVIPIIRLHSLLEVAQTEEKDILMVVIVKKGEKQVGFVIDSLIGQQEIVMKSLGKYLSGIEMIAGATILGNGEVALILDINTLV